MKDLEEYIGEQKEGGPHGNVEMVTFRVNMNSGVCVQIAGILVVEYGGVMEGFAAAGLEPGLAAYQDDGIVEFVVFGQGAVEVGQADEYGEHKNE